MSELQSNNPFRDRASPYHGSQTQTTFVPSPSKNPFLDVASMQSSSSPPSYTRETDRRRRDSKDGTSRRERNGLHHYSPAETNIDSRRRPGAGSTQGNASRDGLARPSGANSGASKSVLNGRPRSNSDASASDLQKRELKDSKSSRDRTTKKSSGSGTGKPKSRKHLDKIDLLDVTGFATSGAGFHHDGPFDACNPNRNKNAKKAPVLAFAKDSTAMSMAAGPPVQPVYFGDHVGHVESFADFGSAGHKVRPAINLRSSSFDPSSNIDPIHGYESVGLGTSTFLEGAPASRSAMLARSTSDYGTSLNENRPRASSDNAPLANGLGRKKSVLQKIRGAYRERSVEAQQEYPSSPPSGHERVSEVHKKYIDDSKDTHVASIDVLNDPTTEENSSFLSPLYRPPSNGTSSPSGGATGLIKGVKSLRVGKKRQE